MPAQIKNAAYRLAQLYRNFYLSLVELNNTTTINHQSDTWFNPPIKLNHATSTYHSLFEKLYDQNCTEEFSFPTHRPVFTGWVRSSRPGAGRLYAGHAHRE